MSPYEACYREYETRGHAEPFSSLVGAYLQHGYVWATPEVFVLAKPIESNASGHLIEHPAYAFANPDAWYLAAFWGDARSLWQVMDSFRQLPLPKVAWYKLKLREKSLHVYPLETLKRFRPPVHTAA